VLNIEELDDVVELVGLEAGSLEEEVL